MPDFDEILRMAANAQAELQKVQDDLEHVEVAGQSGGGLVKIRATAKGRILGVEIDESMLKAEEKETLEDLITAAINDARANADQVANEQMQQMTSGLALPPGMKLPF
ncbi:MAG: YbaB/EbfC family nucleoid-associated protein [Sphingomicrobium sp.]